MIKTDKSIWSYSLYGDNYDSYFKPLIQNIENSTANNAIVVLNVLDSDLERVKKYFERYLDLIYIYAYDSKRYANYPKALRFLVAHKIESNFYFYKDSDSLVNAKELLLMDDWLCTNAPSFMIIRDHHLHVFPILAGMFGASRKVANLLAASAETNFFSKKSKFKNTYSYDQDWLRSEIYHKVISNALVYSNYFYFSGERLRQTEENNSFTKFIGAQENLGVIDIERNRRYLWMYADGMLQLPYYKYIEFMYKKVRVNLILAYLYTKFTQFLGK